MAEKIRAIVFGGYDRHANKIKKRLQPFLDFEHVTTEENPSDDKGEGAQVVVVLSDFASTANFKKATAIAQRLKLPKSHFFECKSENYVLGELKSRGILKDEPKSASQKVQDTPAKPTPQNTPPPETKVGLSADKFWEIYGEKAVEFAKDDSIMEPGAKLDESDLLDLMSSFIGVPTDDCKLLLYNPNFLEKAYIVNTVGTTWKKRAHKEDYEEDIEEAPKSKKPMVRDVFFGKMGGLHPGPYSSIYAISKEMRKYKDFFRQDGKPASPSYLLQIVGQALEIGGIVEEKDGQFFVKSNTEVTLTSIEPPPAPPKEEPKKMSPPKDVFPPLKKDEHAFPELEKLAGKYVSLVDLKKDGVKPEPPKVEPSKGPSVPRKRTDLSDPDAVRDLIEIGRSNLILGQLMLIRSLIPGRYWEIGAVQALQDRLQALKSPLKTLPRALFTNDEWDTLAWETLSKAKFGDIAQILREVYEDRKCSCTECGAEFVFSRGEQEYQFRTFRGEIITPKRCAPCRKIRKEQGGYDPQEKIMRRYGEGSQLPERR